jgi:hypothetical protein
MHGNFNKCVIISRWAEFGSQATNCGTSSRFQLLPVEPRIQPQVDDCWLRSMIDRQIVATIVRCFSAPALVCLVRKKLCACPTVFMDVS